MGKDVYFKMVRIILYFLNFSGKGIMTHGEIQNLLVEYCKAEFVDFEFEINNFERAILALERLKIVGVTRTPITDDCTFEHGIVAIKVLELDAYDNKEIELMKKLLKGGLINE